MSHAPRPTLRAWIACAALLFARLAAGEPPSYADGVAAFERGDYAAALAAWRPLADAGDSSAEYGLALIYQLEKPAGLADAEEALHWLRMAARRGIPAAKNNLAILYAEGRGIPPDPELALSNWREAASAGYGPAMLNLARALERGFGTASDPAEAAQWVRKAADQGVHEADLSAVSAAPVPASPEPPAVEETAPPERADEAARDAASAEPSAVAPPTDSPLESGLYVQLASFPSADAATAAAHDVRAAHPEALGGLHTTVRRVDLGARGVWFRVLVGPVADPPSARDLCDALHARSADADCLILAD